MFESGKALKFVEEDNYENGCNPDTAQGWTVDIKFKAETIEELIKQITEFYGVEEEDIEINSCDEDGRIDINIMENSEGYKATEREIEAWKQGLKKLYSAIYTYNIEKVTRESIKIG